MKRRQEDPRVAQPARKETYLTLLPDMDEGFHTGYQTRAGVVSDGNQRPHEWLESFARNMRTAGEDVGYSIPDVLAGEAQLRRLMRMPHEAAMRHQEMVDWRGALAVLLLWDGWVKDDTWPQLSCEDMLSGEGGAFLHSVRAALPANRKAFGIRLFFLSTERDGVPERKALGMLSPVVALAPAANPGDLSGLLPKCVHWYNRDRKRFEDPCAFLDEADRARLLQYLRYLQALNERTDLQSPLYATDASLSGLIDRFIRDLQTPRTSWRERLEAGDPHAQTELYIRALAVYGLMEISGLTGLTRRDIPLSIAELNCNVLLRWLVSEGVAPPEEFAGITVTTYAFDGLPFAIASPRYLLEPVNRPEETATLQRLWAEISLPLQYNGEWNRAVAKRFVELANHLTGFSGTDSRASRRVIELMRQWSAKLANFRESGDRVLSLKLPLSDMPSTLSGLTREMVGIDDTEALAGAFSDCLLLCAGDPPFGDVVLNEHCAVRGAEKLYAIPPVAPALALWLSRAAEESQDDLLRPRLPAEAFDFELIQDAHGRKIRARMHLTRKQRAQDATFQNRIELTSDYTLGTEFARGTAVPVATGDLPTVRCWPAARLARGQWTAYYVLAQRPDAVDVLVPGEDGMVQGEPRCVADGEGEPPAEHRWQTARTRTWPMYVALARGKLSLGVLPNDEPVLQLKREAPAAVAIDFGSNATTVMLRQGEQIRPASLPPEMLKTLLKGRVQDDLRLPDELLPALCYMDERRPSTFISVMDMFSDDEQKWNVPLLDGHIYYAPDLAALLKKNPNVLYYDLKWGEEPYVVRCLRLFLKQTMLQASLAARLVGSPTLSWRISMPNAMPLYRQEAYLEMVRSLSKEVAADTGMQLTGDMPAVLFAHENQADGLYFRYRNEVNARNGYVNMDVGGGTTDLSVWLGGASRASIEASLLLGCRQILFDSLSSRRRAEFEADFANADAGLYRLVQEMVRAFAAGRNSLRARQKNVFLLDAFFARHSESIAETMAAIRGEGRVSLLESLLLLNFGFLFRLCGELLDRCDYSEETRAQLCPRMEICVAGNGGQFLKIFDRDTRTKLFRLALSALNPDHPVRELILLQSRHPKQEVARGLLADITRLASSVQGGEAVGPAQTLAVPSEKRRALLKEYLQDFYSAFPQAGEKLLGRAFERDVNPQVVRLKAAAEIELETVLDNEMDDGDEFGGYVRAFAAMKRLWEI
ncbi:MAG: hypothetical protein LLF96_06015 [Eubacteriales bacterium]|nr:hypothetical protein [Eubacteriales bacterium]